MKPSISDSGQLAKGTRTTARIHPASNARWIRRLAGDVYKNSINSMLIWIILLLYLSSALSLGRSTFLHIFQNVFIIYVVISINDLIIKKISSNE